MDDLQKLFEQKPTPNHRYVYEVEIERVIDGDTIVVTIDQGFGDHKTGSHLRLLGINCPERFDNYDDWDAARKRIIELLANGETYLIRTVLDKRGSFQRIFAIVWVDGLCINQRLLEEGHAELWGI
jgi:micrococcal nuclease